MQRAKYSFNFKSIKNKMERVEFSTLHNGTKCTFGISLQDQSLLSTNRLLPSIASDMLDLAVAVSVADRLSKRIQNVPCSIHICLPVREPDIFNEELVKSRLGETLYWFTRNHWTIDFVAGALYSRPVQFRLDETADEQREVALWSGGLDCAAGLYNRLALNTNSKYILFGTGSNDYMGSVQRKVARAVESQFPNRLILKQAMIRLKDVRKIPQNSASRARGFVFMLLGAVCAFLEGQSRLYIYENGVGAINLPYRGSELGLDHSRSVHPLSLLKMSDWFSELLKQNFEFSNPFLFHTKAEMCAIFAETNSLHIPGLTVSCDSRYRQPNRPTSCGYCSSCILRRQALFECGIVDKTAYVVPHSRPARITDRTHFEAMRFQAETIRKQLSHPNRWHSFSSHYVRMNELAERIALSESADIEAVQARILGLYAD